MASKYLRGKTYWIKFYVNGLPIRESLETTDKKYADYLVSKKETEIGEGKSPISKPNAALQKVIDEYLESIQGFIGPQQFQEEKSQLKKIFEFIKIRNLADLKNNEFNRFLNSLLIKNKKHEKPRPVTDRTKNGYIVTIKKLIKFALSEGYLKQNPLKDVKLLTLNENDPCYLEEEDAIRLFKHLKENSSDYFLVAAIAQMEGLRIKEILYLEWNNFFWGKDDKNGYVVVRNKENFRTKNRTYRTIPLAKSLENILLPHRKKQGFCVFTDDPYRLVYKTHRDRFKKLCAEANVKLPKGRVFHLLRHSFGTYHARAGASLYKMAEWMGHKSVETTKKYSHLTHGDPDIERVKAHF